MWYFFLIFLSSSPAKTKKRAPTKLQRKLRMSSFILLGLRSLRSLHPAHYWQRFGNRGMGYAHNAKARACRRVCQNALWQGNNTFALAGRIDVTVCFPGRALG